MLKEHSGENANNKLPWKNCSEGAFQGQGEIKTWSQDAGGLNDVEALIQWKYKLIPMDMGEYMPGGYERKVPQLCCVVLINNFS